MRARILKPGFFKNEELLEMSVWGRLLFAGLWGLADREGRLEDRPTRIKFEIFPADQVDVDGLLQQLHGAGLIQRYTTEGLKLIWIPKFLEHQNPHPHEAASKLPPPAEPPPSDGQKAEHLPMSLHAATSNDMPRHDVTDVPTNVLLDPVSGSGSRSGSRSGSGLNTTTSSDLPDPLRDPDPPLLGLRIVKAAPKPAPRPPEETWDPDLRWLHRFLNDPKNRIGPEPYWTKLLPKLLEIDWWVDQQKVLGGIPIDPRLFEPMWAQMRNRIRDQPRKLPTVTGFRRWLAFWLSNEVEIVQRREKAQAQQSGIGPPNRPLGSSESPTFKDITGIGAKTKREFEQQKLG